MSRYECQRCHEVCFTTNPPHLCADIRRRHERQAKAVSLVADILESVCTDDSGMRATYEAAALDIIKVLSGRDFGL